MNLNIHTTFKKIIIIIYKISHLFVFFNSHPFLCFLSGADWSTAL